MSSAAEQSPAGRRRRRAQPRRSASSTRSSPQGRLARDDEQRALAKDLIGEFVDQVMAGTMTVSKDTQAMINAADRADRRADLQAAQRDPAPRGLPEAGGLLARAALPRAPERDGHDAQDPGAQRLEEGPAQGHGAGRRVRPERALQEGLRGGVRHLRRRPLRRPDRRLRVLPPARRTSPCWRRSRTWPRPRTRRSSRRPARSCSTGTTSPRSPARATWARSSRRTEYVKWQSFRDSEDSRYVGPVPAPHPDAAALRPRHHAGRGVQLRGGRRRHRPREVPLGERRLRLRHPADRVVRQVRLVRRDPRRRGGRPGRRACRSTPSRPTRGTWR